MNSSKIIYVRMDDPVGAALHERIREVRQQELQTAKQFVLVSLAEHLEADYPELADDIMAYLQTKRPVGRPRKHPKKT